MSEDNTTVVLKHESKGSYGQILKSSSIIGGAQVVNMLIGMVRTKLVAVLLGPSGVGLVGLYQSAINWLGTLAGLGIGSSAVRQVAEAHGSGDAQSIGRTLVVLRRTCWFTGLLGTILATILAWPISVWAFGDASRAWAIAVLGFTLLLGAISSGQTALVQGVRRIGDLAKLSILGALSATIIGVGLYAWLGERGIVPVLLVSAASNLGFSWWFARRIPFPKVTVTWQETRVEARSFLTLGLAFMWSGLLVAGSELIIRTFIIRNFDIVANGLYQAAWSLSGLFAGFILNAMGADFFPRLTAVANDNTKVNRLVNEQTEIGILLALPGLLSTLVYSVWIIQIFYTAEFRPAAELLPWFVLGIFGRVITWPLGFILAAKGASGWFVATETAFALVHLSLVWFALRLVGVEGVAVAFAVAYGFYGVVMRLVAAKQTEFRWSPSVVRLLIKAAALVSGTFFLIMLTRQLVSMTVGTMIVAGSGCYCLRELCARLGPDHRISKLVFRVPLIGPMLAAGHTLAV